MTADLTVIEGGASEPPAVEVEPPAMHESVEGDALDPALRPDGKRQCVGVAQTGKRCGAWAMREGSWCAFHGGKADPALGGRARAEAVQRQKERALELDAEARLGTRAIISRVFQERAEDVRAVVNGLLNDATDSDAPASTRRAARHAILPWIDQALGRPKESVEVTVPGRVEEIADMSLSELVEVRDALRQANASA